MLGQRTRDVPSSVFGAAFYVQPVPFTCERPPSLHTSFQKQAGLVEQKSWLAKSVPQFIYRVKNFRSTNDLHF